MRVHARSSIGKPNLPVFAPSFHADRKRAPVFHSANRVLANIPKHLLQLVAIGKCPRLLHWEGALDADACILRFHPMIHQRQSVFHQLNEIDLVEVILLSTGIRQKVRDNRIQPLRFARHNVE